MRRLPAHMPAEATSCPRLHRKKIQQPHMDPNDPHGMKHRDDVQASDRRTLRTKTWIIPRPENANLEGFGSMRPLIESKFTLTLRFLPADQSGVQ